MKRYIMPLLGGMLIGHLCENNYEMISGLFIAALLGASYYVHEKLVESYNKQENK